MSKSKTDATGRGKVKPIVIGECGHEVKPVRVWRSMRWLCEADGYTKKARVEYRKTGGKA